MHWLRREALVKLFPVLFLLAAFTFLCFGVPPLLPLRYEADWPQVALVSVPPGTTPDVLSSVPGLLYVSISALQCTLLVAIVQFLWIAHGTMTSYKFILTVVYQTTLVIDMFRLWGKDWLVWILYQLNLGNLCPPAVRCYPVSGAVPWISLSALGLILAAMMLDRKHSVRSQA
jgi:hypothetical protein